MPDRRYRLSKQALADVNGVASYLGERNPSAADRVIDALIDSFSLLANNPDLGSRRDDLRSGARVFSPPRPAHNYVVVYDQTQGGVEISDVVHAARNWPELVAHGDR